MHNPVTAVFIFIIGAVFASFFGVVICRVPKGQSIAFPGSHCFGCGKPLAWHQNIPIVSYLLCGGKCKSCGAKIGLFSFFYEILGALLPMLLYLRAGIENIYFYVILAALWEAVFLAAGYDWENKKWLGKWSALLALAIYCAMLFAHLAI